MTKFAFKNNQFNKNLRLKIYIRNLTKNDLYTIITIVCFRFKKL